MSVYMQLSELLLAARRTAAVEDPADLPSLLGALSRAVDALSDITVTGDLEWGDDPDGPEPVKPEDDDILLLEEANRHLQLRHNELTTLYKGLQETARAEVQRLGAIVKMHRDSRPDELSRLSESIEEKP